MIVYYSYIDKQKLQTRMITFVWVALGLHKNIKQDRPNQHIRLISEGSCDTEDCNNNSENSAFPSQE